MEPPGPAFGGPDDKLRVIRGQPIPDYAALHPGYQAVTHFALLRHFLLSRRLILNHAGDDDGAQMNRGRGRPPGIAD